MRKSTKALWKKATSISPTTPIKVINPEEINYGQIPDKRTYYELYEQGLLGNRALAWNSYEELINSGWKGKICMRSKKGIDRKCVEYNVPLEKVPNKIEEWEEKGIPKSSISFNQSMPDKYLRIQGEVREIDGIFHLRYTTIKKPMLEGLAKEDLSAKDLVAKTILRENLDPSSYDDLETLLSMFPNAVVEFSCYSCDVGDPLAHRNTVIWEVRNY